MRSFVNNQYCCFHKKDLPADLGDGKEPAETGKYRIICGKRHQAVRAAFMIARG